MIRKLQLRGQSGVMTIQLRQIAVIFSQMFAHLHDSLRRRLRHRHNKEQAVIQKMRIDLRLQLLHLGISPQLCFNLQGRKQILGFEHHMVKAFEQIKNSLTGFSLIRVL